MEKQTAAIIDDRQEITCADIIRFVDEFACHIEKRTVVFILCENSVGAAAGYLACIKNRIVPMMLNARMDEEQYIRLKQLYSPQYIWLPESRTDIEPSADIVFEKYQYRLIKTGSEIYPVYSELALLMPTSGSTGDPKIVRHSYRNIEFSSRSIAAFFGLRETDRGLLQLPLQYTMGLSVLNSHLYAGATVIMTKSTLTESCFWECLEEMNVTTFTGVPFSFELLNRLGFFRKRLPSLRIIAQGGGKMRDDLFQIVAQYAVENKKEFFATFGTTETTARIAFLAPELARIKTGSIGGAIPGGELYLKDENHNRIYEPNREGELVYKGENVMLGYAESGKDLIKGDINNGIYATGDLAVKDKDGWFFITGRKSRFLKLYGLRVSLDYSEQLIRDHFGFECACTGDDSGMLIFVVTDKDKCDDIKTYIADKIGISYDKFHVLPVDDIPRKSNGKTDYRLLHTVYAKNQ